MRQIAIDLIGLFGFAVMAEGVRQIYPPAALVVAGSVLFILAVMSSHRK